MLGISGIVRIFEEIEQRLVQSLKRSLGGGKEYDSTSWQAEKLRSLDKFRKENAELMQEYTEQIDTETRQLMQDQFDEGVTDASTLPAVQEAPELAFFGVDTTKVNKLIEDMSYLEKNAETAALRMTDDVYRQTVNRVQLAMSTGAMTLQQAVDAAVKDFLNQGINCIVYSDGRRVNIADYVRMALRTTATRAALQGKSAKFKALGYDTVQVSSYSMCSKTCQPWQGRIYIEDTFSWWDGEVQEYPDGILWGKSNYCGKWFPLLSSAIERGLFHPNCRHTIGLWRDGDPLPESVDNSDTEQRYKLEQQQRALEREIRKAKRKVNGLSDPDNVRKAKAELRQAQKELEDFVDKVNTEYGETVLKPDYGRTTVYEGEVEKPVPVEEPAKPEPVSAPEPEIKEVPESPVSDAPVPEGKAVEVTVSEPEKAEVAYTEVKVPKTDDKSQSYRPVVLNEDDEVTTTRDYEVKAHKAENTQNEVYVSENVNIKPKKLHQIDRHISEALDKMEITDRGALPNILVVSREDMATTDVAVYRAIENQLLICEDMAVYKPQDMPEAMEQLACSENDLSSYIHELYHWIDAEEFKSKYGAVTAENYDDYVKFINNKAKNRLDKLADKGYNILVSEYAARRFYMRMYYETYTEYRVKQLLKEG